MTLLSGPGKHSTHCFLDWWPITRAIFGYKSYFFFASSN